MFESLSEKLQSVFDRLGRKGRLSEEDVELALREVRVALLEADVSLKVVRQFVAAVKEKAVGQDVIHSLSPPTRSSRSSTISSSSCWGRRRPG